MFLSMSQMNSISLCGIQVKILVQSGEVLKGFLDLLVKLSKVFKGWGGR